MTNKEHYGMLPYFWSGQWKPQTAPCGGFSRGVNKPTMRIASEENDFVHAKSHAKKKPPLAG